MKYIEIYNKYVDLLKNNGFLDAKSDILLLIYEIFNINFSKWTVMKYDETVEDERTELLRHYVQMRLKKMPVQYILNKAYFCGIPFFVDENVLIPRFDTEILVEEVLNLACGNKKCKILDMCTGSGAIAVSLKKLGGFLNVDALDISDKAVEIAKKNAKNLECEVNIFKSDMFSGLTTENKYDIIVCNPPYIKSEIIKTLDSEVKDFEPRLALDGDADGLKFYRIIEKKFKNYLNKDGILVMEIGYDQGKDIIDIFKNCKDVKIKKDLSNLDRAAIIYI